MLKKMIKYIFIYIISIIFIGCDNPNTSCDYCYLELEAPDLWMDENGYYHLDFNPSYVQTFARIDAQVGHDYEYVGWTSNTYYCLGWNGFEQCNDVVNNVSYSGSDGIASTILGVHDVHIGMTVTVYCGYYDNYGTQHLDSIKVVIDE